MKIAIIGSGISGLTVADRLHSEHDLTIFEAAGYVGGHTHTVDVARGDRSLAINTGFIVFNDRTYPNFQAMLDRLGVAYQPTEMSFSVRCDSPRIEYNGSDLGGLLAWKRNALNWRFLRMLRDILRFNRESLRLLEADSAEVSIAEYMQRERYSAEFLNWYFIPMGSAIWSVPPETFHEFPIRFIVEFYHHHGLLSLNNRPQWYTITGGSREYVKKLTAPFADRILLNTPVRAVYRRDDRVELHLDRDRREEFDQVIFACHSDQALRLLGDASRQEREILSAFPYQKNSAVLHTDVSVLPRRRRAWASWNYHWTSAANAPATVTYDMNILQQLQEPETYCVTLNEDHSIDPARVLGQFVYHHPVFTLERSRAQRRHHELLNRNRTFFCGAYWGNGFHEDGVNSALRVVAALKQEEPACTAASMSAK